MPSWMTTNYFRIQILAEPINSSTSAPGTVEWNISQDCRARHEDDRDGSNFRLILLAEINLRDGMLPLVKPGCGLWRLCRS